MAGAQNTFAEFLRFHSEADAEASRAQQLVSEVDGPALKGTSNAYRLIEASRCEGNSATLRIDANDLVGSRHLIAVCESEFGEISGPHLRKIRGRLALETGTSVEQVDAMTLDEFSNSWMSVFCKGSSHESKPNRTSNSRALDAAAAFVELARENDPQFDAKISSQQAWISKAAESFSKYLDSEQYHEDRKHWENTWREQTGTEAPSTEAEWQHLGALAGIEPNRLLEGKWSPASIEAVVSGALSRMAHEKRRLAAPSVLAERVTADINLTKKEDAGQIGTVWRAHQPDLDRECAVKFIDFQMTSIANARTHARHLAQVDHPNVVRVYQLARLLNPDSKAIEDAIVMEWVEGSDLDDRFCAEKFSFSEATALCGHILDGVHAIHAAGIAHGDLHSGNVRVCPNGSAKIIDAFLVDPRPFSQVSQRSWQSQQETDIDQVRTLLYRIVAHSDCTLSLLSEFEPVLRSCTTLNELAEKCNDLPQGAKNTLRVKPALPYIPGLQETDIKVLKQLGDRVFTKNRFRHDIIQNSELIEIGTALALSEDELQGILRFLCEKRLVCSPRGVSMTFSYVQLEHDGFGKYLEWFYPALRTDYDSVLEVIQNGQLTNDKAVAEATGVAICIVRFIYKELETKRLVTLGESNEGYGILQFSATLGRLKGDR